MIEATTAIQASIYLFSGSVIIRNTGELRGAVVLGSGTDTFTSSGKVTGPIDMGNGADVFDGSGATTAFTVNGGAGDDTLKGGAGSDVLDGGDGVDTVVFDGAFADYTLAVVDGVLTVTGAASGSDRLTHVEYLRFSDRTYAVEAVTPPPATGPMNGTDSTDFLTGTTGNDIIRGFGGDDYINGREGDDDIDGGAGDDLVTGGAGNDTLTGGAGMDVAIYSQYLSASTVTFSGGAVIVENAVDGRDVLTGFEALSFDGAVYEIHDGWFSQDARRSLDGTANATPSREHPPTTRFGVSGAMMF